MRSAFISFGGNRGRTLTDELLLMSYHQVQIAMRYALCSLRYHIPANALLFTVLAALVVAPLHVHARAA